MTRFATGIVTFAMGCLLGATSLAAEISSDELQKIEAATPTKASVKPLQPRRLLVFSIVGGNHTAGPYGAKALDLMAEKTGAFEVTHTTDPSIFKAENLEPFDAVCFNNSNRLRIFSDPVLRRGLIEFVKGGKGFVGIHAAATNFSKQWGGDWPEGARMVGGIFDGHPWHEKVTVKLDDPDHPLNAAFGGKGFEITDEIYQFSGPCSRENLRVLLSLDTDKTDMDRSGIKRKDNDFPISWVQRFGRGRVFYCSLGHDHDVFWNKAVLQHYLDGIQFALGDLPVDTTPSARVSSDKAAPHDPSAPITDPAMAGPDLLVQGEYVGRVTTDQGDRECGVQVIALGDGKFHGVGYSAGLPGAGWDGSDPVHAEGKTVDGVTKLVTDEGDLTATIRRRSMTIENAQGETLGRLKRIDRKSPTLGAKPPAGAIVLFDGTTAEAFENGRMTPAGLLMEPATSKRTFQSYRSHIEFLVPLMAYARGQGRGNNGYFCQGRYQVQILDSFGVAIGKGECGAIYGVAAPAVNMCYPPLSWQTFDVDFTAAVFQNGRKTSDARMTVRHNGVVVHDEVEIPSPSSGALIKAEGPEPGPVFIQRHNAPLRFRNIWVVE